MRVAYEWHDDSSRWIRSDDNENWEFDATDPAHPSLSDLLL